MQRPKVVKNRPPLLILRLLPIDQLMEARRPSPLQGSTPGSEDTLMRELGHATVPAYKTGDSVNPPYQIAVGMQRVKI